MKKTTLAGVLYMMCLPAALAQTLCSPDGNVKVVVTVENGKPGYSIDYEGETFIKHSPLGLKTSLGDFTGEMKLSKISDVKKVEDRYSLQTIKKSNVVYEANEITYSFDDAKGRHIYDVIFRADNDNVAFKYKMYPIGDRLSCTVSDEATGFLFPEGTTSFLCPQMKPQGGWARTAPSYETFYTTDEPLGKNGDGYGYTFPALFRIGDAGWVMLCETGLSGEYCGSRLMGGHGNLYTVGYPTEEEFGGVGTAAPGLALPGETPWRTVTLGKTLRPIVETTVMWDMVAPVYAASQDYKYGRATWSWIIRMDASCNYEEQKEYIDFAADMGYEYVLVDALWDTQIGYEGIEKLAKYAEGKGVGLFLWYNSNGYWNDAPQGPKHKMHRLVSRREEMKWLKKTGIKGLKIDFIGSDKQQTMQMYEDMLADANEYGLMVIYHGCTIPRGWERMYPNFVSVEAVRASENLSFGQHDNDIEAVCATIHPFMRNSIGNMDFGGSTLNKHYSKDNKSGKTRRTSDVFALATAVMFQAPVQNFAIAPNNLTDAPEWAVNFMKSVPTLWDDVRFIEGYPGKYAVIARRSGEKWYVAAINAQKETLKLNVDLSSLDCGRNLTVYADDNKLQGSCKQMKLSKKNKVAVSVPTNGGALIVAE